MKLTLPERFKDSTKEVARSADPSEEASSMRRTVNLPAPWGRVNKLDRHSMMYFAPFLTGRSTVT